MKTVFIRAMEADDKQRALLDAIRHPETKYRFEADVSEFSMVPRSPFAYWTSDRLRHLFSNLPPFETTGRVARQGGVNGDDFRWLRLWTEVPKDAVEAGTYVPIAKGGIFSPFYADLPLQARWNSEEATFWSFTGLPHRPSLKPASGDFYFRPGLTWPRRTQGGLSLRALPAGCIFADKGPAAFVDGDDPSKLLALLAVVNSKPFGALVELQMAFGSYEVGVLQRTPVPELNQEQEKALATLARTAWSLKRSLDTRNETSHAFLLPALLQVDGEGIAERANSWSTHRKGIEGELAATHAQISDMCFALYSLDTDARSDIANGFNGVGSAASTEESDTDDEGEESAIDERGLVAELVSWTIGVVFGRFDARLATGERPKPRDPDPFDPMPVHSPGMMASGQEKAWLRRDSEFFVDDHGHERDINAAMRMVFEQVFGNNGERWWSDAIAYLDPKARSLDAWVRSSFFDYHLKRYSKSRRKAPIFWQLGTSSGKYSIWLNAHSLTRDSFMKLQNDILGPKIADERRQLQALVSDSGPHPSGTEKASIEEQQTFLAELEELFDEVKRIAPLWNPSLEDGIALSMAPLWRLFQDKSWRRELKGWWDGLSDGKYDWSRLAMHLWPERVIPKCAADRSLAIAHGLESVFWFEDEQGEWKPHDKPKTPVAQLIRDRTSANVKAALKSLIEAPDATTGTKRTRKSKAA